MSRKRRGWAYDPPNHPGKQQGYEKLPRKEGLPSQIFCAFIGFVIGVICPITGFLLPCVFFTGVPEAILKLCWVPLLILTNTVVPFLMYRLPPSSVRWSFFGGYFGGFFFREMFIIGFFITDPY